MRAILTYHSIDESGSAISVSEQVFRDQVAWLARSNVRVVPLDVLMRMPSDSDAIALTFDDGFVNFGDIAAPLMAEHNLPSTLFVVSGSVGKTNRWSSRQDRGVPELPLLNWASLGRMREQGVELGGHTRTHPRLTRVSRTQLNDEVFGCYDEIRAETGQSPNAFAYPYGALNETAVGVVASRFAWGCTTEMRPVATNEARAMLPRLEMFYFREAGQLQRWGTARFNYQLKLRAGARLVRHRLRSLTGEP